MRIRVSADRMKGIEALAVNDREKLLQDCRAAAEHAAERLAMAARQEVSRKARRRTGRLESAIGQFSYVGGASVGAYTGWERKPLSHGGSYTDVNGRVRKVKTVADVGGILEYSATRQLRHIQPAYDRLEEELADQLEQDIDRLLEGYGL